MYRRRPRGRSLSGGGLQHDLKQAALMSDPSWPERSKQFRESLSKELREELESVVKEAVGSIKPWILQSVVDLHDCFEQASIPEFQIELAAWRAEIAQRLGFCYKRFLMRMMSGLFRFGTNLDQWRNRVERSETDKAKLRHFDRIVFGRSAGEEPEDRMRDFLIATDCMGVYDVLWLSRAELVERLQESIGRAVTSKPETLQIELGAKPQNPDEVALPPSEDRWLTVRKAAQVANVNSGVISHAVDHGTLKGNGKKKRARRIDSVDLARWVLKRAEKPVPSESTEQVSRLVNRHVQ